MATALRRLAGQHASYVRAQPYTMRRSMVLVRAAADAKKADNKITKGELVRRVDPWGSGSVSRPACGPEIGHMGMLTCSAPRLARMPRTRGPHAAAGWAAGGWGARIALGFARARTCFCRPSHRRPSSPPKTHHQQQHTHTSTTSTTTNPQKDIVKGATGLTVAVRRASFVCICVCLCLVACKVRQLHKKTQPTRQQPFKKNSTRTPPAPSTRCSTPSCTTSPRARRSSSPALAPSSPASARPAPAATPRPARSSRSPPRRAPSSPPVSGFVLGCLSFPLSSMRLAGLDSGFGRGGRRDGGAAMADAAGLSSDPPPIPFLPTPYNPVCRHPSCCSQARPSRTLSPRAPSREATGRR